jgi:hypothetical protein
MVHVHSSLALFKIVLTNKVNKFILFSFFFKPLSTEFLYYANINKFKLN